MKFIVVVARGIERKQKHLWQQAKNYQTQINNFLALKKTCSELFDEVKNILQKRIVKWSEVSWQKK